MKWNKLLCVLTAAFAVVLSCACDSPESTVEKFYEAIYDGNFSKAKLYCSDDADMVLDNMIDALNVEGSEAALAQYRKDMAFEKSFFRLLTSDEVAFQKKQDEKALAEEAKQNKEKFEEKLKMTPEVLKEFEAAEEKEKAEKEILRSASIVYTRWSKDLVLKHYLLFQNGRWEIVKIENGHAMPEKLAAGGN